MGTDISPCQVRGHEEEHTTGVGENGKVKAELIQSHNIYTVRLC